MTMTISIYKIIGSFIDICVGSLYFLLLTCSYSVPEMQVTIKNHESRTAYQTMLDTEKNKEDAL